MVTNHFLSVLLKRTQQAMERITIKIAFVSKPNLTKKAGTKPINKAAVVTPKASPGLDLSILKHMAKVILMVIEKKKTPITDTTIILSPNIRKGIAAGVLNTAVFHAPILSTKYPPRALPSPMIPKRSMVCHSSLFQEIGIA